MNEALKPKDIKPTIKHGEGKLMVFWGWVGVWQPTVLEIYLDIKKKLQSVQKLGLQEQL